MDRSPVFERNLLAPMRDGVELAADVLRPAGGQPAPALLNFGPYHKDGRGGRLAVDAIHRHFAARGYACVSADLRGLGSSGGISPGPFAPGEAQDGHDLVEWIAAQPWCDGQVAMWGVSYPGVTALSTAATRPAHLKAIVPIHASSDLWRGVAGLGGTRAGFWMRADWGPRMAAYNLMPPQHRDPAGRWRRIWAEHLEGNAPWLEAFVAHADFDAYWRERIVPVERISCPALMICGWRDLYADCTPRDHAAVGGPRQLIMGPWKHEFPDTAREAPAAGLWAMERWFDRWLRGRDNGVERDPPVRVFVQGFGCGWRAQASWPGATVRPRTFWLQPDAGLSDAPGPQAELRHRHDPAAGLASLAWDPWTTGLDPKLPRDQAADDARSMAFTSAALDRPLELQGVAELHLSVQASALPLNLVAKLSDVSPNGASTLITTGWCRLEPGSLAPGWLDLRLPLRATAWRLGPGQRLRLALGSADFPRLWPTPLPAELRVRLGSARLELPECPPADEPAGDPAWGPLQPEALASDNDLGSSQAWAVSHDLMNDGASLRAGRTERIRLEDDGVLEIDHAYGAQVEPAQPQHAQMHSTTTVRIQAQQGLTELECRTGSRAGEATVAVQIRVDGEPHWQREWHFRGDGP